MKVFLLIFLLFSFPVYSQSVGTTAITNNDGGDTNYMGLNGAGTGADARHAPIGFSVVGEVNFGGAPLTNLSGITGAVTNGGTVALNDAFDSTPGTTLKTFVIVRVEGQSNTDAATIIPWFEDDHADNVWTPGAAFTVTTDKQADATSYPSEGDGLSCTTACFLGTAEIIPTNGHNTLHLQVTSVTGTVSIWAAASTGVVN